MIPYDELVVALTQWRQRQGLPVSGSQVARAATAASAMTFAPVATAPHGGFAEDATSAATPLPEYADAAEQIEGTEIHDDPGTGEIDVDSEGLDVIDEQEV